MRKKNHYFAADPVKAKERQASDGRGTACIVNESLPDTSYSPTFKKKNMSGESSECSFTSKSSQVYQQLIRFVLKSRNLLLCLFSRLFLTTPDCRMLVYSLLINMN